MSILKVARMGHPILRSRARALDKAEIRSTAVQKLIDDMIDTMEEYHGVGLAAPQVHEGVRIFIAGLTDPGAEGSEDAALVPVPFINPEVVPIGSEQQTDWEGCLSIPDIRGQVPRSRRVRVRALDREGTKIEMELSDFAARVVQHEADHLDGILFLDRMRSFETLTFLDEFSRYWRD
ncbi:MAG TPA: peptide deformylase [Vicinamibacterales bacterium]|nr:peptide deformylase [Vicinamibacterales bacterium]